MQSTTLTITNSPFYEYSANFNPSILQLEDGRYLMSFRSFRRTSIEESVQLGPEVNHPWLGGPEDINWWQTFIGGFSGTGFLLLNADLTIQRVLDERIDDAVDMRLSYWQGKILGTYNKFVPYTEVTENRMLTIGTDREEYGLTGYGIECCTLMHSVIIYLTSMDNLVFKDLDKLLCQNLSAMIEKNWSPWQHHNNLMISYHIAPKHIVFLPENNTSICSAIMESHDNIFDQLVVYFDGAIVFGLSTPAIPWGDLYLAVGHVKIIEYNVQTAMAIQSYLYAPHPAGGIRYYMFFYTFNPETLEIVQITQAFIPQTANTNVIFPAGLVYSNNVIVSYGDGDSSMKLLQIPPEYLNMLLAENPSPSEYRFKVL